LNKKVLNCIRVRRIYIKKEKLLMDILFKDLRSPTRFEKSPNNIWSTPQLNEFILRSHLNDNIYGGSYDKAHQEKIIEFITKKAPNKKFHKLLDVGCGPGLYTGEFY